ncbi:hypothetical protein BDP27DRAFT_1277797 [Rhodocollybia butyracea]|uniref:Cellulose-binding protein n=1 Tax=Rhodocollybia butyracea TaxID=206335 RepID=A0A9P5P3W3_9AGAR|nr:hypothetical protein BDP27DRAFT_1277797 [Rhodocollybia butyracea]
MVHLTCLLTSIKGPMFNMIVHCFYPHICLACILIIQIGREAMYLPVRMFLHLHSFLILHAFFLLTRGRSTTAYTKPRVFVLTDIENEPDDTMSLARFLLYSNQFEVAGLCATTSVWLTNGTFIDSIFASLAAYSEIYDNLSAHQPDTQGPWPTADELASKTYQGVPLYGLNGVGQGHSSNGSNALMETIDQNEDPTWVTIWSGANVLAQAVWQYEQNHTEKEVEQFVSKIRVYSTSDQDNSGPWLRMKHPKIFWINSLTAMNIYNDATWTGISGEAYYSFDFGGPNSSLVSNDWLQTNIRDISSYGRVYPDYDFIMEGDSPTFLYLMQNGLSVPEHPNWGSWGGRYGRFFNLTNHYVNTVDVNVPGQNFTTRNYTSTQATIWRWREAYQWDFSGRMRWTSTSNFSAVNHNPVVVVNGSTIVAEPVYLNVTPGETVVLDATASYDPDHNGSSTQTTHDLSSKGFKSVKFWQYLEASEWQDVVTTAPELTIIQNGLTAVVNIPGEDDIMSAWIEGLGTNYEDKTLQVIVEIWDDGSPSLVGYKRVVLNVDI